MHVPRDLKKFDPGVLRPIDVTWEDFSSIDLQVDHAAVFRLPSDVSDAPVEIFILRRGLPCLVSSFHGALDRDKFQIPRFERINSIVPFETSMVCFADPSLYLDSELQLAWFTGWSGFDLQERIGGLLECLAARWGVQRQILTGSSGGGFAALQIGTFIPESLAVAFNPQTEIETYLAAGESADAQCDYARVVWNIEASSSGPSPFWLASLPDSTSCLRRYAKPVLNQVLLVQNVDDFHYEDHYLPFLAAAARGGNLGRVEALEYAGGGVHIPPSPKLFESVLKQVFEGDNAGVWSRLGERQGALERIHPLSRLLT